MHVYVKKLKQSDTFLYLDGAICGNGSSDT